MGTGIVAVIPLVLGNIKNKERYFNKGFFENYNKVNEEDSDIYVIKKDILLENYNSFLYEFYDLTGEEVYTNYNLRCSEYPQEMLENIEDCETFLDRFSRDNRNATEPFMEDNYFTLSTTGCHCSKYFMFYSGSYKAILEEYRTLHHIENILSKAMENPLGKSVKFGIYG